MLLFAIAEGTATSYAAIVRKHILVIRLRLEYFLRHLSLVLIVVLQQSMLGIENSLLAHVIDDLFVSLAKKGSAVSDLVTQGAIAAECKCAVFHDFMCYKKIRV